ncbi:fructose PTS transporter subunit IIA, partial [Rhodococcus sp. CX]|uniref:fructose PTS transporter subunit IIA n=3 Tax=unclassified Rhodococcus (in: high G+C Gram-positive bacteria) TaxID=192944 RepID=UPI001E3623BC
MPDTAPAIIAADLITLDADLGTDKAAVITALAQRLTGAGRASDADALAAAALAREDKSATGLPGGLAIPHCRSEAVTAASLGFARLAPKVDFGAPDGPADLVFLIAAPEGAGAEHMKLLSSLARALVRPEFVASLRGAATEADVIALVEGVLPPPPQPAPEPVSEPRPEPEAEAVSSDAAPTERTIVAITACPTGIAHTYMAADALTAAGQRAGVTVRVETQGSAGSTPLPSAAIAAADAVIFATDVGVKGRERFAGKPVVASGVKRAINEPDAMIAEAVRAAADPSTATVEAGSAPADAEETRGGELGWGTRI